MVAGMLIGDQPFSAYMKETDPSRGLRLHHVDPGNPKKESLLPNRALADDLRPSGVKALTGGAGLWRIRIDDHHVVYEINDTALIVLVVCFGDMDVHDQVEVLAAYSHTSEASC